MLSKIAIVVTLCTVCACATTQQQPVAAQTQPTSAPESAAVGERCGTIANIRCGADAFCDYVADHVILDDGDATCQPRPTECAEPSEDAKACGRDASWYPSECHANLAGVDVVTVGVQSVCKSAQ